MMGAASRLYEFVCCVKLACRFTVMTTLRELALVIGMLPIAGFAEF